ncbi:MAG: dTMP kinase [Methanobacteriota archaeon]|nr:MAG: dTMP kinase [Euryarchaeota archaeon]
MAGLFATIEGIDGSGKTTVAAKVADSLHRAGIAVAQTTEPTHTWRGEAVKWAIDRDVDGVSEAFLFLADRKAHGAEIRVWLDAGKLVLSDRYADSTYAYQGARLAGRIPDPVAWLRDLSLPFVVPPDVTYFLAVPPHVAIARLASRSKTIRFEEPAFLAAVDANYRKLANNPRFVTVDATRTAETVAGDIERDLMQRFPRPRAST